MFKNKRGDISIEKIIMLALGAIVLVVLVTIMTLFLIKLYKSNDTRCAPDNTPPGECLCQIRAELGASATCSDKYPGTRGEYASMTCPPDTTDGSSCKDEENIQEYILKERKTFKDKTKDEQKIKLKSSFGACCWHGKW